MSPVAAADQSHQRAAISGDNEQDEDVVVIVTIVVRPAGISDEQLKDCLVKSGVIRHDARLTDLTTTQQGRDNGGTFDAANFGPRQLANSFQDDGFSCEALSNSHGVTSSASAAADEHVERNNYLPNNRFKTNGVGGRKCKKRAKAAGSSDSAVTSTTAQFQLNPKTNGYRLQKGSKNPNVAEMRKSAPLFHGAMLRVRQFHGRLLENAKQGGRVTCKICNNKLMHKGSSMLQHVYKHASVKLFYCIAAGCSYAGFFSFMVIQHNREKHPNEDPYKFGDLRPRYDAELAQVCMRCYGADLDQ